MSRRSVAVQFIAGAFLWGCLLGMGLGVLLPLALVLYEFYAVLFVPLIVGLGFAIGLLLGVANSLVAAVVTLVFFSPPKDKKLYRYTMMTIAVILTFVCAPLSYYPLFADGSGGILGPFPPIFLIIAILAAIASGFASSWISRSLLKSWNVTD